MDEIMRDKLVVLRDRDLELPELRAMQLWCAETIERLVRERDDMAILAGARLRKIQELIRQQ